MPCLSYKRPCIGPDLQGTLWRPRAPFDQSSRRGEWISLNLSGASRKRITAGVTGHVVGWEIELGGRLLSDLLGYNLLTGEDIELLRYEQ